MTTENKDDKPAANAGGEEQAAKPDESRPGKAARPKSGTAATLARLLVLLVIVGALVAGGWFGWQWLQGERARLDAALEDRSAEIARLEAKLERLAETRVSGDELVALREEFGERYTVLGERLESVISDMETLRDAAQGGRRDLLESEIEYLLRIAADELYLTRDVDTAIYALETANDRLRRLADPRYTPVRQLIADHLRALAALNLPDVQGMALKLGSMMREVPELPLRQAQHARAVDETATPAATDAGWWERVRAGVARLADKLVVVQRAEPPPPLLRPEEHFFLYRNVELQLAAARAALLAGDAAAYRQSLELAREWLNRYFDVSDPAVKNAIADITGLLEVNLQPALPDITSALERFRALSDGRRLRGAGDD